MAILKKADLKRLVRGQRVDRLLIVIVLFIVFTVSLALRLTRLKHGYYLLDEFDPYYQYWMAKFVVDRGWGGFAEWFNWFNDPKFWYPYGRNVIHSSFPGLAFTAAFIHLLVSSLGIRLDLMTTCAFLPALLGSLTVVLIYRLGREIYEKAAGLYAAIFLAFDAAYLSRTLFGFFDDESLGILAFVCALIFYVRALKKSRALVDATIAGLFLGYMASTWGAAAYAINLLALHAIVVALMHFILGSTEVLSQRLLVAYSITMSITLFIASLIPRHGPGFIVSGLSFLPLITIALLLVIKTVSMLVEDLDRVKRAALVALMLMVTVGGLAVLWSLGYLAAPERYLSVLVPAIRSPLVASVAEHQAIPWLHFFLDHQLVLPLSIVGLYFVIRRGSEIDLLMALAMLTLAYGASSMARLLVPLAPVLCTLAGVGFSRVVKSLASRVVAEERSGGKRRALIGLSKKWAGLVLIVLTVTFTPLLSPVVSPITNSYYNIVTRASQPQIILTSNFATGTLVPDWVNTLAWMRENLPRDAVIACWWDYGYHITVMTERASTCDNAAINVYRIAKVARAFLSNETVALELFKEMEVTHVVVFGYVVPYIRFGMLEFYASLGQVAGDDFIKSYWMALIAGLNPRDYLKDATFLSDQGLAWLNVPAGERAEDAVLYRMIFNNYEEPLASRRGLVVKDIVVDERGRLIDITPLNVKPLKHFRLVYASEPNYFVLVYEVIYG
ncbi:MAG: glycosyltransferase family 39 protein [Candidatus Nezhaarchaeota archaeon]|nr:glycosyltransferase family 39 protein [Candidatus Nezhaarchaeota archaeon]